MGPQIWTIGCNAGVEAQVTSEVHAASMVQERFASGWRRVTG